MPRMIDINKEAIVWLKKYGSKSGISKHSAKLIGKYGQDFYSKVLARVNEISGSRALGPYRPNSQELTEMRSILDVLKKRFQEGTRYAFMVTQKQKGVVWGHVKDEYGMEHPVNMSSRYEVNDCITCKVYGFYAKIKGPGEVIVNLKLENPRKLPTRMTMDDYEPEEAPHYIKSPEKWYGEVEGLGKHICGKPFTCNCCGRSFPARKGYRIDFKEIYFCMDCKREIFQPSGKGWQGRIIYTPMGNKR